MSVHNLEKIFKPAAVAVIGASEGKGSIGNALMNNIQKGDYPGALFPVNPKYGAVNGLKCYPSMADVGQPIDLAVIATPISTVPVIIGECVKAQVKGVVIVSAGGKRSGKRVVR